MRNRNIVTPTMADLMAHAHPVPEGIDLETAIIARTTPGVLEQALELALFRGLNPLAERDTAKYETLLAVDDHSHAVAGAQQEQDQAVRKADFNRRAVGDLGMRILDDLDNIPELSDTQRAAIRESIVAGNIGAQVDEYTEQAEHPTVSDETLEHINAAKAAMEKAQLVENMVRQATDTAAEAAILAIRVSNRADELGRRSPLLTSIIGSSAAARNRAKREVRKARRAK